MPEIIVAHKWFIFAHDPLVYECTYIFCFMTRKEYELIYSALQYYRFRMTDAEEVLAEKILDDIFYPHFDKLAGVADV